STDAELLVQRRSLESEIRRALGTFRVVQHRFLENADGTRLHPEVVAHQCLWENNRLSARERILRFDPIHKTRPKNLAAIGDCARNDRHLQRSHVDFLADAEICGAINRPAWGTDGLSIRKQPGRLLPCAWKVFVTQADFFTQMATTANIDNRLQISALQAVVNKIAVAGMDERFLEI